MQEKDLYPDVKNWLHKYLRDRNRTSQVKVLDSSRKILSRLISDNNYCDLVPAEWVSWDIQVDIVGFVIKKTNIDLAFVECKNKPLNLRDLSQLLGYSRVANPQYSFLVSPQGISESLSSLLKTYNRVDILRYHHGTGEIPKAIIIATWLVDSKCLDLGTIITADYGHLGNL